VGPDGIDFAGGGADAGAFALRADGCGGAGAVWDFKKNRDISSGDEELARGGSVSADGGGDCAGWGRVVGNAAREVCGCTGAPAGVQAGAGSAGGAGGGFGWSLQCVAAGD